MAVSLFIVGRVIAEIFAFFMNFLNKIPLLICFQESLRLANGTDRCSGRVEVLANFHWGKICNNLASEDAAVVCQELGCGAPKKIQESFNFGDSTLRGYTSRCSGPVDSFSKCNIQDYTGTCEAVSLSCAGKTQKEGTFALQHCSTIIAKDKWLIKKQNWHTVCALHIIIAIYW